MLPFVLGGSANVTLYAYAATVYARAQSLGMKYIRASVPWNYSQGSWTGLEMTVGTRSSTLLSNMQTIEALAATYGLKMIWIYDGFLQPTYPSTYGSIPCTPAQFAATGAWLATNMPGSIWEILNEVDLYAFGYSQPFTTAIAPSTYVAAVQGVYASMKAADPKCKIIVGGVANVNQGGSGQSYIASILSGVVGYCDILSLHVYTYPGGSTPTYGYSGTSLISALTTILGQIAVNLPTTPIWITETGWESNGGANPTTAQQAAYLQQWLQQLAALSAVKTVTIYQIADAGGYWGLTDGSFVPKQSYQMVLDLLPDSNRFALAGGSRKRVT